MKYYSAREAARILGVAHTTIIRWIENGELKANTKKHFIEYIIKSQNQKL